MIDDIATDDPLPRPVPDLTKAARAIVRDEPSRSRFVLDLDGQTVGELAYHRRDGVVVLPHTEIHGALRGQGLGAVLARGALDLLRERGELVLPSCWFVAEFIDAHPEYRDLVWHR